MLIAGAWHFITPVEGMAIFDQSSGQLFVFRSVWQRATAPALPTGGSIIDIEARAALAALVDALKTLGILATAAP